DGASNGVPADWDGSGIAKSQRTADFPKNFPDPDNQTWADVSMSGLYNTNSSTSGASPAPSGHRLVASPDFKTWTLADIVPPPLGAKKYMPATSWHPNRRRVGIPTTFDFQTNLLNVNGLPQNSPNRRG